MSSFFRFVEYARTGLLWITPELAAAGFSGLVTTGGRKVSTVVIIALVILVVETSVVPS